MFTGIVQSVGSVKTIENDSGAASVWVTYKNSEMIPLNLGDSIAINGVCLTIREINQNSFMVSMSNETLSCTTLALLEPGEPVNLEPALLPTMPLGGHMVSGHVDCVGQVVASRLENETMMLTVKIPESYKQYVIKKGSICIDGVSLTINEVDNCDIQLCIIQHTLSHTVIADYILGTRVNIEIDMIARYVERLIECHLQKNV